MIQFEELLPENVYFCFKKLLKLIIDNQMTCIAGIIADYIFVNGQIT